MIPLSSKPVSLNTGIAAVNKRLITKQAIAIYFNFVIYSEIHIASDTPTRLQLKNTSRKDHHSFKV